MVSISTQIKDRQLLLRSIIISSSGPYPLNYYPLTVLLLLTNLSKCCVRSKQDGITFRRWPFVIETGNRHPHFYTPYLVV